MPPRRCQRFVGTFRDRINARAVALSPALYRLERCVVAKPSTHSSVLNMYFVVLVRTDCVLSVGGRRQQEEEVQDSRFRFEHRRSARYPVGHIPEAQDRPDVGRQSNPTYNLCAMLLRHVETYPNHRVVFCGISHGAALAQAAALKFKDQQQSADVFVITWNAYRWTDDSGSRAVERTFGYRFLPLVMSRRRGGTRSTRYWDSVAHFPDTLSAMPNVALLDADTGGIITPRPFGGNAPRAAVPDAYARAPLRQGRAECDQEGDGAGDQCLVRGRPATAGGCRGPRRAPVQRGRRAGRPRRRRVLHRGGAAGRGGGGARAAAAPQVDLAR
ncbi:unnamed protein product [Prorocentrum cordatum]|uniref:Fungal lipase-type domain-containing protein n=1 Tax=Prorocentrum cordatum TaxID=2364126 RepID=A0ABN9RXQ8_9DINO|nr:unnamed protein product [Polarella glacialis]